MEKTALLVIDAQQEYFAPIGKSSSPTGPGPSSGSRISSPGRAPGRAGGPRGPREPPAEPDDVRAREPGARDPPGRPAGAGEPVLTKHLPGSFTNTGLEEHLRRHGIEQVIVSGFMTQMCCDTTAREAAHRGFKVLMAADAMAAMPVKGPDGVLDPRRPGPPDAPRQPERLPGDGDDVARLTGGSPAPAERRADAGTRRPPASPPTALREIGSPGRTRTCDLVVTRAPAFPRGLDYLIPVGARRAPVGGGRFPRRSLVEPRSTTLRSSLCTVPRATPARGLRSGFPYPPGRRVP